MANEETSPNYLSNSNDALKRLEKSKLDFLNEKNFMSKYDDNEDFFKNAQTKEQTDETYDNDDEPTLVDFNFSKTNSQIELQALNIENKNTLIQEPKHLQDSPPDDDTVLLLQSPTETPTNIDFPKSMRLKKALKPIKKPIATTPKHDDSTNIKLEQLISLDTSNPVTNIQTTKKAPQEQTKKTIRKIIRRNKPLNQTTQPIESISNDPNVKLPEPIINITTPQANNTHKIIPREHSQTLLIETPHSSNLKKILIIALVFILALSITAMFLIPEKLNAITKPLFEPIIDFFNKPAQTLNNNEQTQQAQKIEQQQKLEQTRQDIQKISAIVSLAVDNNKYLHKTLQQTIQTLTDKDPEKSLSLLELATQIFPEDTNLQEQYKEYRHKNILSLYQIEKSQITENDIDLINPLGGGSTLTFSFRKNDNTIAAFKPLQTRRQSNYRAEIAAWILCKLINCHFNIPQNKPVYIEYETFHKLYNKSKSKKRDEYKVNFTDLIWTEHNNQRVLWGTQKNWVPNYTRFPIEITQLWEPFLTANADVNNYPPLPQLLLPIQQRKSTQNLYDEILKLAPDLTTQQLMTQISDIIVFDYLTGNWDRFSTVEAWWGVNCQFEKNHLVSIDNGAAFQPYTNEKVQKRLLSVQKFSKLFINNIRALDKDKTLALLFENPSNSEKKAFEQLWKQREKLLKIIDDLIQKHGTEQILAFP